MERPSPGASCLRSRNNLLSKLTGLIKKPVRRRRGFRRRRFRVRDRAGVHGHGRNRLCRPGVDAFDRASSRRALHAVPRRRPTGERPPGVTEPPPPPGPRRRESTPSWRPFRVPFKPQNAFGCRRRHLPPLYGQPQEVRRAVPPWRPQVNPTLSGIMLGKLSPKGTPWSDSVFDGTLSPPSKQAPPAFIQKAANKEVAKLKSKYLGCPRPLRQSLKTTDPPRRRPRHGPRGFGRVRGPGGCFLFLFLKREAEK